MVNCYTKFNELKYSSVPNRVTKYSILDNLVTEDNLQNNLISNHLAKICTEFACIHKLSLSKWTDERYTVQIAEQLQTITHKNKNVQISAILMDWNTNNVAKKENCTKIDSLFDKISQLQVVKMPNTLLRFHSAWTTTPQFDSEATFVVCHTLLSSLSVGPIRLGFHLARLVTVCGCCFGTSFLSF